MSTKFADYLNTDEAKAADCALDYLDGEQEEELIEVLNHPNKGRKDWKEQGMIPRWRNITKMIVQKSGLLFDDGAPVIELQTPDTDITNVEATKKFVTMLEDLQWEEFYNNMDQVVRLLKTALVLVQWDPETNKPVIDALHKANCEVILKKNNKDIDTLIYKTGEYETDAGEVETFRVFTDTLIQDITSDERGNESITLSVPNPYGIIPVAVWHDTATPRVEFWNYPGTELVSLNEMYNLHLTDSEFAASWAKRATLFTNATMPVEYSDTQGSGMSQFRPGMQPTGPGIIGGPGKVIQIETQGLQNVLLEYKSPQVDLKPIDDMFKAWIRDFAADWSVNVQIDGSGSATSGFQLVVEEIDNLQLRKKRQRQCEAHLKRFYEVFKLVCFVGGGIVFPDDVELEVTFSDPGLPVNQKEQEEVWSIRIKEGRASRVDYFMAVEGMTKE